MAFDADCDEVVCDIVIELRLLEELRCDVELVKNKLTLTVAEPPCITVLAVNCGVVLVVSDGAFPDPPPSVDVLCGVVKLDARIELLSMVIFVSPFVLLNPNVKLLLLMFCAAVVI